MSESEKRIIELIPQLNQEALFRVLKEIKKRLSENQLDEYGLTKEQWEMMKKSIKNYSEGKLETLSREDLIKRLSQLRGNS